MTNEKHYGDYNFPHISGGARAGHPGGTTAVQDDQVFQMRTALRDQGHTDRLDTNTLLRYLHARNFDVASAIQMFIKSEEWRNEIDLDNCLSWGYSEKMKVFEYYPRYYHKTDKDGRPIYIEQLGRVQVSALNKITTQDRMLNDCAFEQEMYINRVINISKNHYPERLGSMYIINVPWGFPGVWSRIDAWLDPATNGKISVLGKDYMMKLGQQISVEHLPKELGGTCNCDGGCGMSNAGPWNEEEYQGSLLKE